MRKAILFLFPCLLVIGCDHQNEIELKKGTILFSLDNPSSGGRINSNEVPYAVLFSIKDNEGNFVVQNEKRVLYSFGEGKYVSESIELISGNYSLTEFFVLNSDNQVVYLTPKENSEFVQQHPNLIADPLPVSFSVSENHGTNLNLKVVPLEHGISPQHYGYATFGFSIVELPDNDRIILRFISSTNPHMVTRGYDSVFFTLTSPDTTIRKSLNIISPVEAVGEVYFSELNWGDEEPDWELKVQAYYESIDVVPSVVHVNEAVTNTTMTVSERTSEIKVTGISAVSRTTFNSGDPGDFEQELVWENWAHAFDLAGNFRIKVKNDICNPEFEYKIFKNNVTYVYYEKGIGTTDQDLEYQEDFRGVEITNPNPGTYIDIETFANFCPTIPDDFTIVGSVYFLLSTNDNHDHTVYLVWMYEDTPIDPIAGNGGFILQTSETYSGGRKRR